MDKKLESGWSARRKRLKEVVLHLVISLGLFSSFLLLHLECNFSILLMACSFVFLGLSHLCWKVRRTAPAPIRNAFLYVVTASGIGMVAGLYDQFVAPIHLSSWWMVAFRAGLIYFAKRIPKAESEQDGSNAL